MNKLGLISKVAKKTKSTKISTKNIIDATFDEIISALAAGDYLQVSGFGRFRVVDRPPRVGRNPGTGDKVDVPEKKIIKFKASNHIRNQVNP